MYREQVLENFYMIKEASDDSFFSKVRAGYVASRDYSPEEIRQLGTRGYIVRPKGPTNTGRPNERIITHRGKRYAYDHREYTHGTGKRLGIGLGVVGAGAGLLAGGPSRALGVGALSGGLGYAVGRKMMSDIGEGGVKGLIDQRHRAGSAADLKRIKLRQVK